IEHADHVGSHAMGARPRKARECLLCAAITPAAQFRYEQAGPQLQTVLQRLIGPMYRHCSRQTGRGGP
ncbi:MAG: hypothetical protein J0H19_08325, partial [Rhodospirillales bacterium]|nr:hypothetical protein [Rhodospirillales bacterium]